MLSFIDEWIDEIPSDGDSDSSNIESDMPSLSVNDNSEQEEPQPESSKILEVLKITKVKKN